MLGVRVVAVFRQRLQSLQDFTRVGQPGDAPGAVAGGLGVAAQHLRRLHALDAHALEFRTQGAALRLAAQVHVLHGLQGGVFRLSRHAVPAVQRGGEGLGQVVQERRAGAFQGAVVVFTHRLAHGGGGVLALQLQTSALGLGRRLVELDHVLALVLLGGVHRLAQIVVCLAQLRDLGVVRLNRGVRHCRGVLHDRLQFLAGCGSPVFQGLQVGRLHHHDVVAEPHQGEVWATHRAELGVDVPQCLVHALQCAHLGAGSGHGQHVLECRADVRRLVGQRVQFFGRQLATQLPGVVVCHRLAQGAQHVFVLRLQVLAHLVVHRLGWGRQCVELLVQLAELGTVGRRAVQVVVRRVLPGILGGQVLAIRVLDADVHLVHRGLQHHALHRQLDGVGQGAPPLGGLRCRFHVPVGCGRHATSSAVDGAHRRDVLVAFSDLVVGRPGQRPRRLRDVVQRVLDRAPDSRVGVRHLGERLRHRLVGRLGLVADVRVRRVERAVVAGGRFQLGRGVHRQIALPAFKHVEAVKPQLANRSLDDGVLDGGPPAVGEVPLDQSEIAGQGQVLFRQPFGFCCAHDPGHMVGVGKVKRVLRLDVQG